MNVTETAHVAVPFPEHPPAGYRWLAGEPPFDPDRHLALEPPAEVVTLAEFGYPDAEIEPTATPVAVSAPFRVLSDEGAAVMQRSAPARNGPATVSRTSFAAAATAPAGFGTCASARR